ncbi:DUF882 domain-containing protein [Nitratireductor sp. GCM10026969]|uniref:DUF882 domain-containing protein n=1 Tax=Nitratireductor sp. GCM10026969 TaxID=3252645 RepID=UPI00360E94B6
MLALALLLSAAPVASAETRSLRLYFTHTGERAEITYKRNGRYLKSGLQQINHILRDWRRDEPTTMDPRLLDLLWEVYRASGSRDYIHVVSAYRSPQTNAMLRKRSSGVAKKSQHMLGKAIDFFLPDVNLSKLRNVALKREVGGVGYYPRSGSPFIHIDVAGVRHWPRMSRRELVSVFPDGKTLHVPSDGKPLPGYQQALAAYEARERNGGSIQVADDSGKRRGRGLLAALFGGGADEEEDNANSNVQVASAPQPARSVPQRQAEPERPAAPEPAAPKTILAALPERELPVPREAPRPDIGVGTALPVEAPAPNAAPEAEQEPEAQPTEALVASNVPLPTRRPEYAPPEPEMQVAQADAVDEQDGDVQDLPTATAYVTPTRRPERPSSSDVIAELLTEQKDMEPQQTADRGVPVPAMAPKSGEQAFAVASLSQTDVPSAQGNGTSAGSVPLPSDSIEKTADTPRRVELLKESGNARAAAFISSGVRTTPKTAKPGPQDAGRERAAKVLPVEAAPAHNVLKQASLLSFAQEAKIPTFTPEIAEAPKTVYTTGFQREAIHIADARRFTGKAVNFLSVAKFAEE